MREFAGWIVAAALLVGGGAYWLAVNSGDNAPQQSAQAPVEPTATAPLPNRAASPASPQPKKAAPAATARSAAPARIARPANTVPAPAAQVASRSTAHTPSIVEKPRSSAPHAVAASTVKPRPATTQVAARKQPVTAVQTAAAHPGAIFPVKDANGAKAPDFARPGTQSALGERQVQLAAFRNIGDAKFVWRSIERSYPAMKHFQPSLIQNRDASGQAFYQFEVGTASQADSEMLCQSLQQAKVRCTIVRLPGT